jgi:hypothetical protein
MRKEIGSVQFVALAAAALFLVFSLVAASGVVTKGARTLSSPAVSTEPSAEYGPPVMVGKIETPDITESSGLSASECQDVLWTHNDAGNAPLIFAMDTTGKHLGTWKVEGSNSVDWESIATHRDASGKCFLLIADFGDNDERRESVEIYRVAEPRASAETSSSSAASPLTTERVEVMRYTYSDGSQNAETILVHPKSGDVYIVTKEKSGPAGVHRIAQQYGRPEILKTEKVAEVSVPSTPEGLLTGGSFSPDGTRLMLCDKKGGYEFVLPAGAAGIDDIWKQKPIPVNVGDRKQGEGVSYGRDGVSLYASSEKKHAPLYVIKRKA